MATSTLTSKGQITIPKSVRERLGLHTGDTVEFRFDERGRVLLSPTSHSALGRVSGVLRHLARSEPVSIEEMRRAVLRRAAGKTR